MVYMAQIANLTPCLPMGEHTYMPKSVLEWLYGTLMRYLRGGLKDLILGVFFNPPSCKLLDFLRKVKDADLRIIMIPSENKS